MRQLEKAASQPGFKKIGLLSSRILMPVCRNFLHALAFLLGWLSLFKLAADFHLAFSGSTSTTLLLLSPLLIGLTLAVISARSFATRQWQKGPALVLAAATFARLSYGTMDFFTKQQQRADSWLDVLTGLAASLGWTWLTWLLSIVVYRSSDRILAATGNELANLFRRKPRHKAH